MAWIAERLISSKPRKRWGLSSMNKKDLICQSVIAVLGALLVLLVVMLWNTYTKLGEAKAADTEVKYYTYTYDNPKVEKDSLVGSINIPIPVYAPRKIDTIYVGKDSTETVTISNDTISIPITQKVYSDSNYTAYVSGFCPALDSIKLVIPEITKTRIVENPKRFSIGAIGGLGYGFLSNKIEPFVGVGFSYRLY